MASNNTELQPNIEGKTRFLTLGHIDRRTRSARRARDLIAAIEEDLGGADRLSVAERQLATRAGVLSAVIEHAEVSFLSGHGDVELGEYLAAINALRRVLLAVGLKRRSRDAFLDPLAYAKRKAQATTLQATPASASPPPPEQAR